MPVSSWAASLDAAFSSLDLPVLEFFHHITLATQGVMIPGFVLWGVVTDNGLVFLAAGLVLALFPQHRRLGVSLASSVALGAAVAFVVKGLVARPRPFLHGGELALWWQSLGLPPETGFSFPSGHVTTIMAAATVGFLRFDRRWSWVFFLPVLGSAFSRCSLLVHYPSDVVAGMLIGAAAAGMVLVVVGRLLGRLRIAAGGLR